jgi:hypothetical protein
LNCFTHLSQVVFKQKPQNPNSIPLVSPRFLPICRKTLSSSDLTKSIAREKERNEKKGKKSGVVIVWVMMLTLLFLYNCTSYVRNLFWFHLQSTYAFCFWISWKSDPIKIHLKVFLLVHALMIKFFSLALDFDLLFLTTCNSDFSITFCFLCQIFNILHHWSPSV